MKTLSFTKGRLELQDNGVLRIIAMYRGDRFGLRGVGELVEDGTVEFTPEETAALLNLLNNAPELSREKRC